MGAYYHKSFRDGKPAFRFKPLEDLYILIKPEVDEAKIRDGPHASDMLFKYCAYNYFHMMCLLLSALLAFTLLLSPIVWMDITDTDANFFNQTNATSGIPSSLKSFSSVSFLTFLIPASIAWTNTITMINPSMRRLQWDTMKFRIMLTLGLNVVYTVASATMFPHVVHGLYLYCRMAALVVCVFDSVLAHMKLRLTPEKFGELYGGSGKNGFFLTIAAVGGVLFILQDMFRHYVVAFVTDNASIVSLDVRNPLNGNMFEITNRQLMDGTYFTCTIFFAQSFHAMATSSKLKTASVTQFLMTSA